MFSNLNATIRFAKRNISSEAYLGFLCQVKYRKANSVKLGEETVKLATEIKLRAERKAGEILRETPKQAGARGVGKSGVPLENSTSTLADLGITKKGKDESSKDHHYIGPN